MITHMQIKKLFNDIAINHDMIKSFGIGDIWEVGATSALQMPCMWAIINPAKIEGNQLIMSYSLLFFDTVNKDESNEDEVLSDTQRIALDVIALLKSNNYSNKFFLNKNILLEDFTERFDDEVSGWKTDIEIRQLFDGNACQVSINEIPQLN